MVNATAGDPTQVGLKQEEGGDCLSVRNKYIRRRISHEKALPSFYSLITLVNFQIFYRLGVDLQEIKISHLDRYSKFL